MLMGQASKNSNLLGARRLIIKRPGEDRDVIINTSFTCKKAPRIHDDLRTKTSARKKLDTAFPALDTLECSIIMAVIARKQ